MTTERTDPLNDSRTPRRDRAVTEWDRHHDPDEYARDLRREYDEDDDERWPHWLHRTPDGLRIVDRD